ncbi:tape measure protein [Sporosarcina sp. FSL K6-1522]|uniref:tape measure protein n=1 Tax=Sporosarcina sp. FSL K6-1522 TaxID=2921554 RepID=UPI003159A8ED
MDDKRVGAVVSELDRLEVAGTKSGKGVKAAADSVNSLGDSSAKAGSSVKGAGDAVDKLSSSSANAAKGAQSASNSVDSLASSANSAGKDLKGADSAVDELASSSADASRGVNDASGSLDDLGSSASDTASNLQGADTALDDIASSGSDASGNIDDVTDSLNNLGDSGSDTSNDLQNVDTVIDDLSNSTSGASDNIDDVTGSLDNLSDSAEDAANNADNAGDNIDEMGQQTNRATMGIKELVVSLGLVALASKAFEVMKSALDGAIARFDTLEGFPVVMERMGFSSEQAESSIAKLSDGIQGLPTTLDGIVASAQNIAILTGDLDNATDTALALNNAFLASGSNAANAERGLTQYVQMLSKGTVDMMSWRTLQETMGYALKETAEAFGFAGASAQNDLYAALQQGTITFDAFNAKLLELNDGVGGFAELAVTGSEGIATSMSNLKNAATVGVANIIKSFDNLSKATTGKTIYKNIDSLKVVVSSSFKAIGAAIEGAAPIVIAFASAAQATIPVVQALSPAIIGLVAAYASYVVVSKATAAIQASNSVLAIAQASTAALTIATRAQMAAAAASATATGANAAATVAQTGAVSLSTLAIGVMTGKITLSTAATIAKTVATYALGAALKFLGGPIGWLIGGIGVLVTGIVALNKWVNKSSEEANRLSAETEALGNSTNSLNESIKSNAEAYKESISGIETNRQKNEELMRTVEELSAKENKSAAEKQLLAGYINELNGSIDGLNLSYNEEANALNMSSEELGKRVQLMAEQERFTEAMERQIEIVKEQYEAESKLDELTLKREEWRQAVENGTATAKLAAEEIAKLQEEEDALKVTSGELSEEYDRTMKIIAEATENGVNISKTALDEWISKNEELIGSMSDTYNELLDLTTNAFSKMSEKSKASGEEMIANLEHNQEMTRRWGTNIAELYNRAGKDAIDDGFVKYLEGLGPSAAAEVQEVADMSDAELKKYSELMANSATVASDSLKSSLGEGLEGAVDIVTGFVDNSAQSLRDRIAQSDFESIGTAIPEGLEGGVEKGSKKVSVATAKMADDATNSAKDALGVRSPSRVFNEIGTNITEGLVLGINGGTAAVIAAIQKMFQSVQTDSSNSFKNIVKNYDTSVKEIETALKKLPEITQKAMKSMLDKLKEGASPQVKVMTTLAKDLLTPFKNTPTQFQTIGKDAMAGLNRGLTSGEAQVMATARRIANSAANEMRKALDIHSPSRVTTKIGEQTGEGVVVGLESKQKDVNATSKKMAEAVASIIEGMHADVKNETSKHNEEIKMIEKRTKEDISLIHAKAAKEKRKLTEAELIRIERMNEDSNKKIIALEEKIAKEREKIATDSSKILIELSEKYVKQKKANGEMSLKDEGHFWNQMYATLEVGSVEYEKAMQNHQNVVKQMRDKMEKTNEDYAKRIVEIDKKLVDDTKKLNDEYNQAYSKRVDDLLNVAGLLDEFVEKDYVSGYQLIHNMQTQVDALEEFSSVIGSLGDRIDNDALFEELQALGPKSITELRALNSMSDEELKHFAGLYEKRFELARTQANKELEPLKEDITQQIKDLNEASQKELLLVEKEWKKAINNIVLGTQKEFDSMNQVGKDAMKGLEGGILSMESSLMATARRIADSIKATMQSALDIHSPSRVMRDQVGKMIPAGIAVGIKDNARMVYNELENMANKMIMPATPEQALGTSRMAYSGRVGVSGGNTFTSRTDKSKKQENDITIITNDSGAKEMERTLRRLQFGL